MAPRLRAPQPAHLSSLLPVASLDREIAIVNFWIKLACSYCSRTNWWLVTGGILESLCSPNARLATSKKIRRKTWATLLHSFGMLFRSLLETLLTHLACRFWQLPKTTAESRKFIPWPWNSCSLPGYPHHCPVARWQSHSSLLAAWWWLDQGLASWSYRLYWLVSQCFPKKGG